MILTEGLNISFIGKLLSGIYSRYKDGKENFEEVNNNNVINRFLLYQGLTKEGIKDKIEQIEKYSKVIYFLSKNSSQYDIKAIAQQTSVSPELVKIIGNYLSIYRDVFKWVNYES